MILLTWAVWKILVRSFLCPQDNVYSVLIAHISLRCIIWRYLFYFIAYLWPVFNSIDIGELFFLFNTYELCFLCFEIKFTWKSHSFGWGWKKEKDHVSVVSWRFYCIYYKALTFILPRLEIPSISDHLVSWVWSLGIF